MAADEHGLDRVAVVIQGKLVATVDA